MKDPRTTKLVISDELASDRLKILGNLAAGVAHELNNFFFVIRGFSELSRLDLSNAHPVTESLDRIEEAVDQAEGLTRMILECAHPSGDGSVSIQLHPLVKQAVKLVRESLSDEIRVKQTIAPDAVAVKVDPVRLFPVIVAMLRTACNDLASQGGLLWISLAETAAAESEAPSALTLNVGSTTGADPDETWRRLQGDAGVPTSPPPGTDDAEWICTTIRELGGHLEWRRMDGRGMCIRTSFPPTPVEAVR